jgi:1,4-alpha-glucan branching enzyme
VVVISSYTPVPRENYTIPMPKAGRWSERINTDAAWYGGSNKGNEGAVTAYAAEEGQMAYATLSLPPLATLILKYDPDQSGRLEEDNNG